MTVTTQQTSRSVTARPATDPAPGAGPGAGGEQDSGEALRVWVLPDRRPAALWLARHPSVPAGQAPLTLTTDCFPPGPGPADTQHNRAPWFADPPDALPDPRRFACSLAQAVAEALVGRRPVSQLIRWVEEGALAALGWQVRTARGPLRATSPPVVRSLRIQVPAPRAVEVAARLGGDGVPPVMALRLETRGQRWICTALELGPTPDRPAPDRPDPDRPGAARSVPISPAAGSRSGRA